MSALKEINEKVLHLTQTYVPEISLLTVYINGLT